MGKIERDEERDRERERESEREGEGETPQARAFSHLLSLILSFY